MMTSSRVGTLKLDKFNPTASHHPVRRTLKLDKFNPTASHHPVRRTLKLDKFNPTASHHPVPIFKVHRTV